MTNRKNSLENSGSPEPLSRQLLRYGVAAALVVVTFWAREALVPFIHAPALILFVLPILLSAWAGGLGPGLLATFLSAVGAVYFVLSPKHAFHIYGIINLVSWISLWISGICITLLTEASRRSARKAAEAIRRNAELLAEREAREIQHRYDQLLRETQEQRFLLAAIVEFSEDAIVSKDLDSKIISWNKAAEQLFGYSAAEAIGRSIQLIIPPELHGEETHILSEIKAGHRIQHYETVRCRKNGTCFPSAVSVSPLRDLAGQIIGASNITRDISERKKVEEKLRQALQILELANVLVRDMNDRIIRWSQGSQQLYGYTPEEALGKISHDLFETQFSEPPDQIRSTLMRTGHWRGELHHSRADGHRVTVSSHWVLYRDDEGHPTAILQVDSDITAAKRAEEALRYQLDLNRSVTEQAIDPIFISDAEGRVVFMNPEAEKVFGFPRRELLGRLLHNSIHHHYSDGRPFPESECPLSKIYASGQTVRDYEGTFFRKDGSQIRVVCSCAPLQLKGQRFGAMLIAHDITARRRAEEELRKSEEKLRLALNAAQLGMWDWDLVSNDLGWSPLCKTLYGVATDEPVNYQRLLDLIHPDDRERVNHAVQDALDHRLDYDTEMRVPWTDGSVHWLVAKGRASYDETTDQALRMTGVVMDITAEKRAEETLRQTKDQLANANETLEQRVRERTTKLQEAVNELEYFSYTITHDMRAPLRAMRGFSQILLEDAFACLHPDHREYLTRIAGAADRMDNLIRDALNYSKIVHEEFDLHPVDVQQLLREIIESYPGFQPPHSRIHIDGPIPPVQGNKAGLIQCFSNLLSNAIKFVAPGTTPEVCIYAEERGNNVRIWFADNGIGIPRQYHDQIFQMFQQLSKDYEGTGIGLALVQKAAQRMGGSVGLESEPGRGSHFWLEFAKTSVPAALEASSH